MYFVASSVYSLGLNSPSGYHFILCILIHRYVLNSVHVFSTYQNFSSCSHSHCGEDSNLWEKEWKVCLCTNRGYWKILQRRRRRVSFLPLMGSQTNRQTDRQTESGRITAAIAGSSRQWSEWCGIVYLWLPPAVFCVGSMGSQEGYVEDEPLWMMQKNENI